MGTNGTKRSEDRYQDFVNRRLDRIERAVANLERSTAQTDRMVRNLVRYGVSLRRDVRRLDDTMNRLAKAQARTEDNLAEATDKLNGLIGVVDKMARR
jgi:septal ring factor EnvC (AmiA/AmiB activator)